MSGYTMVTGAGGRPRFLPSPAAASSVPADSAWDDRFSYPGIIGSVYAVARMGTDVIIGGIVQTAGGHRVNNIARWDGSHWYPLGSGVNGSVEALVVKGTDLYAGGTFTMAGGDSAKYIARWDGSDWSPVGGGMNHFVNALAADSARVYAGGYFTAAGGDSIRYLAAWNDTTWSSLGTGPTSAVGGLALGHGYLYAGGSFDSAGGVPAPRIARWNGAAWSALGSGVPGFSESVFCLSTYGDDLFAAGLFDTIGGTPAQNIARWDGFSWSALGLGISQSVGAILATDSGVYAGGWFQTAGGMSVRSIAHWNGISWGSLDGGVGYASVFALLPDGTDIIVGGDFTFAGGSPMNFIARWDGGGWSPIHDASGGYGISTAVPDLAVNKTTAYVAGQSGMEAGTLPLWSLARWSGTSWSDFGFDTVAGIGSVAVIGDALYAAGTFTSIAGTPANNIARWDGSTWSALGSGVNGAVHVLEASGSDLYVGGNFTTAGGGAANYIARWSGAAWFPLGGGPVGFVSDIAIVGSLVAVRLGDKIHTWDGVSWTNIGGIPFLSSGNILAIASDGTTLYVGGEFSSLGTGFGVSAANIGRWRSGVGWSEFGGGTNGPVWSVATSGTDLYIGGDFDSTGGVPASGIARWDGLGWSALGSGFDGSVRDLGVSGLDLYAVGLFSTAGGKPSTRFARWNIDDGSPPDWAWAAGLDDLSSSYATATASDSAGNVYVAGYFTGSSIDFGNGPLPGVAGEDLILVKYSSSGTPLWGVTAGTPTDERATGVAVDPEGNILLTAWSNGTTMTLDTIPVPHPGSNRDIILAKFNGEGDALWVRGAGGSLDDVPNAIAVDADGNAYLTGRFTSPSLQFGATTALTNSTSPFSDLFVAVYDPSGTALWSRRDGDFGDEAGSGVAVDTAGNIYCTGGFTSPSITFGSNPQMFNSGGEDLFVVRYDTAGTPVWSRSAGGSYADAGTKVAVNGSGEVLLAGVFCSSSLTFGGTTLVNSYPGPGLSDILLVKYSAAGTALWAQRAGGARADAASGVVADTGGNVYLAGHFPSERIDLGRFTYYNTAAPSSDLFVTKFDSGGRSEWAAAPGGSGEDFSGTLGIDPGGNLILAGSFTSPSLGFGTHTVSNGGPASVNMFAAKLGTNDIQVSIDMEVSMASGWNLVSLPVLPENDSVAAVFPAAISEAFAYTTGGYVTASTMDPGAGYWLKYPAAVPVVVPGFSFSSQSVPVFDGWNLVGSVSAPIAASSITSTPPGLVTGNFFAYQGGYLIADTVHTGEGYWVKVSADGQLDLSSSGVAPVAAPIRIVPTSELPPAPPTDETASGPAPGLPAEFALDQNYPNPFNPSTLIRYQLPAESKVTLRVYNLLGEEVAVLADEDQEAGFKSVTWDAAGHPTGVYFCRMQAGEFNETRKLVIMK